MWEFYLNPKTNLVTWGMTWFELRKNVPEIHWKKLVYIKHYVPGRLGFLRQLFFVNIAAGGPKARPFQQ